MTEILSKEKEFLKLNEQLNRMAATMATETHATLSQASSKTEDRFLTYQKSNGPSTLLKKKGAGDLVADNISTISKASRQERVNLATARGKAPTCQANTENADTITPSFTSRNCSKLNTGTITKKPAIPKGNETFRSHTHTKTHTSLDRVPPTNTSTFTVKYRNPKFVESPSLELLIKDEWAKLASPKPSKFEITKSLSKDNVCDESLKPQTQCATAPKRTVSTEGIIKFLKSKIGILEEDHARISLEMSKQKVLLDKSLERSKLLEQQRDLAESKGIALKEQLSKIEAQLDEASVLNKERSREQLHLQKELESCKRELKITIHNNHNYEVRLNRAHEELKTARETISAMKIAESEIRQDARIESEGKDKMIKSLKKQRADLLNAYKKQLFLIDNLKRQSFFFEQAKMSSFNEKDFATFLEYNLKD